MRRFAVAGLVPCPPQDLAAHLLDAARASRIWPEVAAGAAISAGEGWWEAGPDADAPGVTEVVIRYRRVSSRPSAAPEVLASTPGTGERAVHRFLAAEGGCLWTVESHARPREGEPWMRFVRRRLRSRAGVVAMVDAAAGYFAAQR